MKSPHTRNNTKDDGTSVPVVSRPKPKLTAKEQKFIEGLVAGKPKVQAAMAAYPRQSYKGASVTAADNLAKPRIIDAFENALAEAGITQTSLADVIGDAMVAKKTYQADGELKESMLPDHQVRMNAVRTAATILNMKNNGGNKPGEGTTINFNIGNKSYIKGN